MHLYIPTMDATLVEFSPDGRVRLNTDEWHAPSVQERRAIIHAAQEASDALQEVLGTPDADLETGVVAVAEGGVSEEPMPVTADDLSAMLDAARRELLELNELLRVLDG